MSKPESKSKQTTQKQSELEFVVFRGRGLAVVILAGGLAALLYAIADRISHAPSGGAPHQPAGEIAGPRAGGGET